MKIFGHEYEIIFRDMSVDDLSGRGSVARNTIEINTHNHAPTQMEDTFLHEVLHQISDILKLSMKEALVHRLAAGLHTVIKDNPEIFSMRLPEGKNKGKEVLN
ncbi:MAG: hypothetical protein ABFD82_03815 [Syntrophaceae bacterium]